MFWLKFVQNEDSPESAVSEIILGARQGTEYSRATSRAIALSMSHTRALNLWYRALRAFALTTGEDTVKPRPKILVSPASRNAERIPASTEKQEPSSLHHFSGTITCPTVKFGSNWPAFPVKTKSEGTCNLKWFSRASLVRAAPNPVTRNSQSNFRRWRNAEDSFSKAQAINNFRVGSVRKF